MKLVFEKDMPNDLKAAFDTLMHFERECCKILSCEFIEEIAHVLIVNENNLKDPLGIQDHFIMFSGFSRWPDYVKTRSHHDVACYIFAHKRLPNVFHLYFTERFYEPNESNEYNNIVNIISKEAEELVRDTICESANAVRLNNKNKG